MEEKVIVKGNAQGAKPIPYILIALGLIVGVGISYMITVPFSEDYMLPVTLGGGAVLIAWGIVLLLYVNKCEICVTDKRVYGIATFGKRVDIPMDSVSAVGTVSILKGVSVASSSGVIKFLYIANADEVHAAIASLILDRQNKKEVKEVTHVTQQASQAEELQKFKLLLDSGVITEEEFAAKKKQILGL